MAYYQRRPQGAFSIERLFAEVRRSLPEGIDGTVAISRFASEGIIRRIYNTIEAAFRQGDVNHITGDVHYLAFLLRKKRTLLTIHDLGLLHSLKGWRKAILVLVWYWIPINRAAVVSVISESTRRELLLHISVDPRKVRVVLDCVSGDFAPAPKKFDSSKPVVLVVGTSPNKNIERVVQALQGIPCRLRVLGSLRENQLSLLLRSAVEYSSVSGISDAQVVEEYRHCDMLVFASTYEGFGLPIVEAQATGRPVVTSNILSMPEVAGHAACLVDPFDVASIRDGILKVINDAAYRDELVEAGFENVERFRPGEIARQYAEIYRDLVT